jgi:hypothetical protein
LQKTDGAKPNSYIPGPHPSPLIIVGPMRWNNTTTSTNLIADAAKGAYAVTVASAAGFSAGQIVLLDEASGAGWQADPQGRGQIWASQDWRVVWQKHNPVFSGDDFAANQFRIHGSAGEWFPGGIDPLPNTSRLLLSRATRSPSPRLSIFLTGLAMWPSFLTIWPLIP